jgi:hypothetical protein
VSGLEHGCDLIAQDLPHQLARELILRGRHRRVGRKDAAAPHLLHVGVGCKMDSSLTQILCEQAQGEERSVSPIHVISGDPAVAKGGKHFRPADSQKRLLTEAVKEIAAVKIVCQLLSPGAVLRQTRIEQVDWNGVSRDSLNPVTPGSEKHGLIPNAHRRTRLHRFKMLLRQPRIRFLALIST